MVDRLAPQIPAQPKDRLGQALAHADQVAAVGLPRGRGARQVALDHETRRKERQRQQVHRRRCSQGHSTGAAGRTGQGPGAEQGDHGIAEREREQRPLHAQAGEQHESGGQRASRGADGVPECQQASGSRVLARARA